MKRPIRISAYLSALTLLPALFAGCNKAITIKSDVTPSQSVFGYEGGQTTVSLFSNMPWTASCNVDGVTISPSSGDITSSTEVTITVSASTSPATQSIPISFVAKEPGGSSTYRAKHIVTLEAAPHIGLSRHSATIPATGGGVRIELSASRPWGVNGALPQEISVSPSSAKGSEVIAVSLPANPSAGARYYEIEFALNDFPGHKAILAITQPAI